MNKEQKAQATKLAKEVGTQMQTKVREAFTGKRKPTTIGAIIAVVTIISSILTLKNYTKRKKANRSK